MASEGSSNVDQVKTEKDVSEATQQISNLSVNEPNESSKEEESASDVADSIPPADPANFAIKHPLQNRWTLWFDNPGKKTNSQNWSDNLKRVVTFDTVSFFLLSVSLQSIKELIFDN